MSGPDGAARHGLTPPPRPRAVMLRELEEGWDDRATVAASRDNPRLHEYHREYFGKSAGARYESINGAGDGIMPGAVAFPSPSGARPVTAPAAQLTRPTDVAGVHRDRAHRRPKSRRDRMFEREERARLAEQAQFYVDVSVFALLGDSETDGRVALEGAEVVLSADPVPADGAADDTGGGGRGRRSSPKGRHRRTRSRSPGGPRGSPQGATTPRAGTLPVKLATEHTDGAGMTRLTGKLHGWRSRKICVRAFAEGFLYAETVLRLGSKLSRVSLTLESAAAFEARSRAAARAAAAATRKEAKFRVTVELQQAVEQPTAKELQGGLSPRSVDVQPLEGAHVELWPEGRRRAAGGREDAESESEEEAGDDKPLAAAESKLRGKDAAAATAVLNARMKGWKGRRMRVVVSKEGYVPFEQLLTPSHAHTFIADVCLQSEAALEAARARKARREQLQREALERRRAEAAEKRKHFSVLVVGLHELLPHPTKEEKRELRSPRRVETRPVTDAHVALYLAEPEDDAGSGGESPSSSPRASPSPPRSPSPAHGGAGGPAASPAESGAEEADPSTSEPLAEAMVQDMVQGTTHPTAAATLKARLDKWKRRRMRVVISKKGYVPVTHYIKPKKSETWLRDVALKSEHVVKAEAALAAAREAARFTIKVRVKNRAGVGIADARVELKLALPEEGAEDGDAETADAPAAGDGTEAAAPARPPLPALVGSGRPYLKAQTGEDGVVEFTDMLQGFKGLVATISAHRPKCEVPVHEVKLKAALTTLDLYILTEDEFSLQLHVTSPLGKPIEGATVRVLRPAGAHAEATSDASESPGHWQALSDEHGLASLAAHLPKWKGKTLELRVTCEGYCDWAGACTIRQQQSAFDLHLMSAAEREACTFSVAVTVTAGGRPQAGASVALSLTADAARKLKLETALLPRLCPELTGDHAIHGPTDSAIAVYGPPLMQALTDDKGVAVLSLPVHGWKDMAFALSACAPKLAPWRRVLVAHTNESAQEVKLLTPKEDSELKVNLHVVDAQKPDALTGLYVAVVRDPGRSMPGGLRKEVWSGTGNHDGKVNRTLKCPNWRNEHLLWVASADGLVRVEEEVEPDHVGTGGHRIPLVELPPEGQVRCVLRWAATPTDLDFYLVLPFPHVSADFPRYASATMPARTQIFYKHKEDNSHKTGAVYQKDCTTGYGPETILLPAPDGPDAWMRLYVHNCASDGMIHSKANVNIYRRVGAAVKVQLEREEQLELPNSGSLRDWDVCAIHGGTGEVCVFNQLMTEARRNELVRNPADGVPYGPYYVQPPAGGAAAEGDE